MSELRLAGIIRESIVDGPGIRDVIFTQGCPHKCKGCHNPTTHECNGGKLVDTEKVVADVLKNKYVTSVTLSGGDPFIQAKACKEIVMDLKDNGIDIVCYTGYTFEYIMEKGTEDQLELLKNVGILIDGKYIEEFRDLRLAFRGSSNQRIIDVQKSIKSRSVITVDYDYHIVRGSLEACRAV